MRKVPMRLGPIPRALTLVLALVAGLVAGHGHVGAQYYDVFDAAPYSELTGLQEAIQRHYQNTITAQLNIYTNIARFDGEANAAAGLDALNAYFLAAFAAAPSPLAFEPVEATALGADTRAYHATVNQFGSRHDAAFVQVRDGVYVYGVLAINYNNHLVTVDVDQAAVDLITAMIATPPAASTPAASAFEEPISGTWARFPEVGDGVLAPYDIRNASNTTWYELEIVTPEPPATPYGNADDLVAIVDRSYATIDPDTGEPAETGRRAYVQIAELVDPASADASLAGIESALRDELAAGGITLVAAESGVTADEVVAATAETEIDGQQYRLAAVLARSGPYVVMVLVSTPGGDEDPMPLAAALTQRILDTEAASGLGELGDDGTSTGAIWDKLPATGDEILGDLVAIADEELFP